MEHPLLHRQLQEQRRQWVKPKDQRHLQGYAEVISAILQSRSACLGKWLSYLGHRNCQARAHMVCRSTKSCKPHAEHCPHALYWVRLTNLEYLIADFSAYSLDAIP